ncbi:RidA family protein [Paenibacillus eucommiae]|uniref:Enamine deaminase RidA (YjgF/YER057c/UK114 family) n=1 Tax=Paenibacillus eucommiae TaxID=1355755 RepID=A0ABS4ILQ0_9BACL|nr:RidA family protein [Paenibacillus eucommiae]MBP1988492.1 enamine deaminase RidA (YjgF/YER057c/UK114 family) [Paenibacillus eucommiae]
MLERKKAMSGAPWETIFGYCRALRIGNVVEVSGTTAMKDGEIVGIGDAYQQTKRILQIIEEALEEVGASMQDVTRTRIFVTDIKLWEQIAKAHREAFSDIMPVASMVEVSALMDPRLLVEIEAQAYLEK